MHAHIETDPEAVWVAPHKLWPASTGRGDWVWGHGPWDDTVPVMSQELYAPVEWFALGFTFTPRGLLEVAWPDLGAWEYGMIDMGLSRYARQNAIPMRLAILASPKHVHFYPEPGGPR